MYKSDTGHDPSLVECLSRVGYLWASTNYINTFLVETRINRRKDGQSPR